ncbi:unnamed protein product [Schistosoma rodhaini]|uniref:Protein KRI1 homolog n=2 Tax=Schistosoma mansoni TaxID=6183 RepID=A0A5K4EZQ5_SCHMA|nr:unnamed protein product [Schistosoma rodhaini]
MQFKINQDFAKNYNRYRQKEEYEKLKAKHGDAKLKGIKLSKLTDTNFKVDEDVTAASVSDNDDESTYSSSSDTDDSWEEKQHDDFLTLYQALCKNDPSLNDPNKQWFREPSESDDESSKSSDEISESQLNKNNNKEKQIDAKAEKKRVLKLRDYEREFLLAQDGVEDETVSKEAQKIAQMESDDVLKKMTTQSIDLSKEQFIQEANEALNQAAVTSDEMKDNRNSDSNNDDLNFLRKRKSEIEPPTPNRKKHKSHHDLDKIVFTDSTNKEAEEFLRDYIINKRWIEPNSRRSNKIPTYSDVLRESGLDVNGDKMNNLLNDDDILDEDDEFLVKLNNLEQGRLQSLGVNTGVTKLHKTEHRFEEEDKEFIKSYPRVIENSIGQTLCVKSKRAERRQAKIERKRKEKQAKLQELTRLRNLKLSMLAEKIERIKRTCGPGSLLLDSNELIESQTKEYDSNDNKLKNSTKVDVLDVAEYLDEDWDPEKHEKLLDSMFGKQYEEIDEEIKKPEFSDDSDLEVEPSVDDGYNSQMKQCESKTSINSDVDDNVPLKYSSDLNSTHKLSTANNNKSRRGKRRLYEALEKSKPIFNPDDYPDYEKYFEEFYQLHCEDIIPGPTSSDDIYCRFKYRNVMPNDFGLSTEEILKADPKELNAWVSLKRITAYLSHDEEIKDQELYSSNYQMKRKMSVIGSLNNPNATWYPNENHDIESSEPSKKKRRRHKKKKSLHSEAQGVKLSDNGNNNSNGVNPIEQNEKDTENSEKLMKLGKKKKKYVKDTNKLNIKDIFKSRLQAAGITLKEYHRTMRRENSCKSESVNK